MDDFGSESDSDFASYWRDWVSPCKLVICLFSITWCRFVPSSITVRTAGLSNLFLSLPPASIVPCILF